MEKVITGFHGIEEALKAGRLSGDLYLCRKNSRIDAIKQAASRAGVGIQNISPSEMDKKFGSDNRGVVLKIYGSGGEKKSGGRRASEGLSFEEQVAAIESENAIVVVLDGVTDPHNYGAIIRSADQLGVDLVVTRARRSASESDTVARTSAGAVNYVGTAVVSNLGRALDFLKEQGFWIYGADMGGKLAWDTDLRGKTAIVMGSEGKGMSRLVAEKCDAVVSIPSLGSIDSLNVSVAAGVLLYEVRRQQGC